MPQLPTYTSERKMWTDQPEAIKTGAAENLETAGKALGVVQEVIVKWSNALDTIQYTTAKANYETGVAQLEAKAAADPDYNNADAYYEELNKLKEQNVKGFQNKAVESRMSFEIDHSNQLAQIKIGSIFKKKQIEVGQVKAMELVELEQSNYINAENDQEKLNSASKIKDIIDLQVSAGIFGPKEGKELYDKSIKEAQDAIKDAESLKRVKDKELRLAEEAVKNETEAEYIRMRVKGVDRLGTPISREELIYQAKKDMNANLISPEFADRYINALKSPKAVKAKTIDVDFANIISDINKGTKTPEKIRKDMLQDLSDGYLSEQDFASASTYLDMLGDKSPDDLVAMNIRKSWLGVVVFSENTTGKAESRSRMSRSFVNKLQSGVDAQTAAVEVMREEVVYLHPEVINKPEGGEYFDDTGKLKRIMPNGDILNINSEKKDTRVKEKK